VWILVPIYFKYSAETLALIEERFERFYICIIRRSCVCVGSM